MKSYGKFVQVGVSLDPIHVGTGGTQIGRVDLTIVREPSTRLPKIPGSSLAGVYRTYVAMYFEEERQSQQSTQTSRTEPFYPNCAGLGQPRAHGKGGHCGRPDCPVCTVFGFARGKDQAGGFAGLAAFSDAQILLFPVPTRQGPYWVTCPMALRQIGLNLSCVQENAVYLEKTLGNKLNLGWLLLNTKQCQEFNSLREKLNHLRVPAHIIDRIALLPDHIFIHVVNSNLEVRTSVSINPETGAAEEGALFSYEALPRGTVVVWEIIAKNPKHFKVGGMVVDVTLDNGKMDSPEKVCQVAQKAHPYLEHLGIGGMGTRGMGRLRVFSHTQDEAQDQNASCQEGEPGTASAERLSEQPE